MPSLFSRSRTNSTTKKTFLSPSDSSPADEFGRVSSRTSNNTSPISLSKKDKKKANKDAISQRAHTIGHTPDSPTPFSQHSQYAEGAFLPLSLERNRPPFETGGGDNRLKLYDYGFLSYERHVILAPEQLSRLVDVVTEELSTRGGITSPFIFSTTALDVSFSSIKRLIRAFLDTCDMRSSPSVAKAEAKWRDEARFAGLYELGMCLRWGMARVVRVSKGQEVRGLIQWDTYLKFRESEQAKRYPPGHFQAFLDDLSPTIQAIVKTVLTLLARLTANSTSSGHTPPTLSPLFGPLFFGLGPSSLAFHHTYLHYLRTTNAMEHVLLAFIRWQDTPRVVTTTANTLGVPARLKDWIKGYPSSLPFLSDPKKDTTPQPRKGARTIRVLNVRRNVRLYSIDLVKTAATWGSRATPRGSPGPSNALYASKEWERISPATLKLPPKYSEAFKKRMNLAPNVNPECGPGYDDAVFKLSSAPSTSSSYMSTVSSAGSTGSEKDYLQPREGEERFRNLTDLKWGEFESMGFGGIGEGDKKLEFDLTESARQERVKKRQTLSWNDFSAAGFSRAETPLSATLQFSSPIVNTVASWPSQKADLVKKLKKAEKSLPHFGWDTEPVVFTEEVVEEAFVDVFCDLVYGSGWMDGERCEEVDRDSNWALVEFKATPPGMTMTSGSSDPRTTVIMVLFEEFVPLEYRQMLSQSSTSRRRLPSLFAPKSKQWKPAATLNGRPYEVGHVPRSPSYREVEFEGLLQAENSTKVISATPKPRVVSMIAATPPATPKSSHFNIPPLPSLPSFSQSPIPPVPPLPAKIILNDPIPLLPPQQQQQHQLQRQISHQQPDVLTSSPVSTEPPTTPSTMTSPAGKRMSRFRLPANMPVVPSPNVRRKSVVPPAQYSIVEFETRLASYSDDEFNNANETESVKQRRRQSKDDAWVDILVGGAAASQHARGLIDGVKRRSLRGSQSDPDLVSMEVAQVLAAVKNRSPSPPSMLDRVDRVDRVDRDFGLDRFDQHVQGLEIDEIETVPRTSNGTRSSAYSDHRANGEEEDEHDEPEEDDAHHVQDDQLEEEELEEEVLPEAVMKARQRAKQGRPGYFDLHPERLQQLQPMDLEDEIRAKLARSDSDEEEGEEEEEAAALTPVPHVSNVMDVKKPAIPDISLTPVHQPVAPQQQTNGHQEHVPPPPPPPPPMPTTPENRLPGATPQSRTAALIEMYRQREQGTVSPAPISPPSPVAVPKPVIPQVVSIPPAPVVAPSSRIPVRPLPKEPPTQAAVAGLDAEEVTPQSVPATIPPTVMLEEVDAQVPFRYIHGAPLHNVLEEEEEELED